MIEELHRLIPASTTIIPEFFFLVPDNVIKSLDHEGIPYKVNFLRLVDWDLESSEMDDEEILELIHLEEAGHQGNVLICTEACFPREANSPYRHKPFRCDTSQLRQFILNYDIAMFFNGDVIMLCEESRTLTIFHHDGLYIHVKL